MRKIIGGMFGLDSSPQRTTAKRPRFLDDTNLFLVNGRSALALIVGHLQPSQVWLPSFLCDALPAAVRAGGSCVRFYPVSSDLDVSSETWLDEVRQGDGVVIIDYFGFSFDPRLAASASARGAWVIEDAVHALLSEAAGEQGDFVIFSTRKMLGVPDGGIIVLRSAEIERQPELLAPPNDWWTKSARAASIRHEFDVNGESREWFDLFREVEATAPIGHFRMSDLTRSLLADSFDYAAIRDRRRSNYDVLATHLGDLALFPVRPAPVVPLAFPIRLKNRDRVRAALFADDIFPPIHWEIAGVVPKAFTDSHRLSSQIMSLPCDQRYDGADMARLIAGVRRAIDQEQ